MSKRDYIQEILAKKERSFFQGYRSSISLYELESDFNSIKESTKSVKTYLSIYVVGIAACLELAVRNAIKTFIDSGSPYLERVSGFKDFLRFDLNITKALHDKQITFGELISHFLPVKNVENINSHLGVLLDGNFSKILAEIREFREPSDEELFGSNEDEVTEVGTQNIEPMPLVISDVNSLMANLERLFTTRHIIAHEADFDLVSEDDAEDFFEIARIFIDALEEVVEQTLTPNLPRTSFGMSIINAEKASKIYLEMEETYKELHSLVSNKVNDYSKPAVEELETAQKAFNEYLEAETNFEETLYSPLTGNSSRNIYAHVHSTLCKQRTERLKDTLEFFDDSEGNVKY